MSILSNGTVLPHGLVSAQNHESNVAGFNRSYKNTGLKAGFIVASYAATDPNNKSQLCTEYDVQTIEQFENKGSTSLLYRNCLSCQGFGGIGDFLEYTLRPETYQSQNAPIFSDQDGAIVLIQCLDNIGSKAIVVGTLMHPDRATTITSTDPQLAFEYNGVSVKIANDGSFSLTFNGATDSKGVPTDSSQGTTTFEIQTDGSFQFTNSEVTLLGTKSGELTITTSGDCNVNSSGAVNVTSSGDTVIDSSGDCDVTASGNIVMQGTQIELNGQVSGITTFNSHLGVIDLITNVPVMPSLTTLGDI